MFLLAGCQTGITFHFTTSEKKRVRVNTVDFQIYKTLLKGEELIFSKHPIRQETVALNRDEEVQGQVKGK